MKLFHLIISLFCLWWKSAHLVTMVTAADTPAYALMALYVTMSADAAPVHLVSTATSVNKVGKQDAV